MTTDDNFDRWLPPWRASMMSLGDVSAITRGTILPSMPQRDWIGYLLCALLPVKQSKDLKKTFLV